MSNAGTITPTKSPTRLRDVDKLKAEIAQAVSISDVAEKLCGVDLVGSGNQAKGLCPIHEEATPSFHVNDAKNAYHCFGCKAGGDAIGLVREVHNLGFKEALMRLAELGGIDVEPYLRPLTLQEQKTEALRAAALEWVYELPSATGRLSKHVAGVLHVGTSKSRPEALREFPDYLFEGTIFPYFSPGNRLVGWKCRQDGPDKKMFGVKQDHPIYEVTLFGIQEARKHIKNGVLYVVEGEYDQGAVFGSGLLNVVATGGSAFTEEHMDIVERLSIKTLIFAYDGDESGLKGIESVCKRYWDRPGIEILIASLPEGSDPDDLVKAGMNIDLFPTVHALEWLLRQEWNRRKVEGLGDKLAFVEWVREEYGKRLDGAMEDLIVQEVSRWLDLPDATALDLGRVEKGALEATDSERAILGRAIRDHNYFTETRKTIGAEDFFMLRHRRIWQTLENLLVEGLEVAPGIVLAKADEMGVDEGYLQDVLKQGADNMGWHENRVVDLAVRRSAREQADKFRERIADVSVDSTGAIGELTADVANRVLKRRSSMKPIQDQVDEAMEILHIRMRNPDSIHGINLGSQFPRLMKWTQGFQPRRLVLLAATSGAGKSTLGLQCCASMAIHQSIPTDFISLEMDESEILFKLCAHLTGVNGLNITGGNLEPNEAKLVEQAMMRIRKSPLRIVCPDGLTPNEFVLHCHESKLERRTEVFMLDYVQFVGPDPGRERDSDYKLYGDFGRDMKTKVARAMDACVVAIAQLNRAAKEADQPTKENMGDSYDLVRSADVILILKADDDTELAELWVDKNRQGPGGQLVPIIFQRPQQTFYESSDAPKAPDYRVTA